MTNKQNLDSLHTFSQCRIFLILFISRQSFKQLQALFGFFYTLGVRVAQWVRSLDLTTHTILSPIRRGFAPCFVNYKKGCTRLAAASDKAYQLLAHGRWFSPASSTIKTGRHDIAEILLKMALKHQKSNQSNQIFYASIYSAPFQ
jgi:hypothetical protein